MRYGYVGLGHLGANLAMNLVKAGYQVTVTDLNKDNAKKLIAAGAIWADTPKGVAENSDAVITCLPSPKVSMAVLTGKDGILAGLKKGGTWIEKKLYGREYMGIDRATFLIGKDGKITKIWRKVKVKGHADEVLAAAKGL